MLIATLLVVVGLLVGAWAATTRRLRLSGVVVVSLLAVYSLLSVATLPVFVLSTVLAYLGVQVVQDRWLLYGRQLLMTAIVLGAVVPVGVFLALDLVAGRAPDVSTVEFLGSILPGIAAYNYHREDADRRRVDLVASVALFVGLVGLGALAFWLWATPPCTTCGLVGFAPADYVTPLFAVAGSDVAAAFGLPAGPTVAVIGSVWTVTIVVVSGLALAEIVRSRWGLRPVGMVSLPLLALFALRSWWVLPVYLGVAVVAAVVVQLVHRRTLLYGRALLSIGGVVGVVVTLSVALALGLETSLALFFTGLLAGIGAYNLHVAAPAERVDSIVVNAGLFTLVFALARALITPLEAGLASTVTGGHLLAAALVLVVTAWVVHDRERDLPSNAAILDASAFGTEVVRR